MTKLDPRQAKSHKRIYQRLLDELDIDIVKEIMSDPNGEEAMLLNQRVEQTLREEIDRQSILV